MNRPVLYYIRHGETAWSLTGQHTGKTDLPLTAQGEVQAAALAARLSGIDFSQVLTSPLLRARRTCELAGLGGRVLAVPDLAEWDYGDYEGLTTPDIRKQRPDWNLFRDGCPNGEMPDQIVQRVDRLIRNLVAMQANIAIFSHGHFGQALAARWLDLPVINGPHFVLDPATLSILGFKPGLPELRVNPAVERSMSLAHTPQVFSGPVNNRSQRPMLAFAQSAMSSQLELWRTT